MEGVPRWQVERNRFNRETHPLVRGFYRLWWPWAIGSLMAALGALAEGNPWLLFAAALAAGVSALQWRDNKPD